MRLIHDMNQVSIRGARNTKGSWIEVPAAGLPKYWKKMWELHKSFRRNAFLSALRFGADESRRIDSQSV